MSNWTVHSTYAEYLDPRDGTTTYFYDNEPDTDIEEDSEDD
jgi:hypothetical protein